MYKALCTSGSMSGCMQLILAIDIGRVGTSTTRGSCGAVRQELHVRKSGRKADDLQTSKLRNRRKRRLVDSAEISRPCDVGALASPCGNDPTSHPIHFSFGWGLMLYDLWNLMNVFLKIGLGSQIFRNGTTRVQDAWGLLRCSHWTWHLALIWSRSTPTNSHDAPFNWNTWNLRNVSRVSLRRIRIRIEWELLSQ